MSAPVTLRHRALAFRSRYPWVSDVPAHLSAWLGGDDFFHHHDPEGLSLNSIAQALADIEAEALASKPMLYEAHGTVVAGPPGDAKGTGCLRCDMAQTIGEHDPGCASRATESAEMDHLERGAALLRWMHGGYAGEEAIDVDIELDSWHDAETERAVANIANATTARGENETDSS